MFPQTIQIENGKFIDELGREVLLNGINVVSKSKQENYLFQAGPEFYKQLREWGFNCIRFILIWDGLEPQPDQYNEAYLAEIDKRIQWAADNGVFVILDMHQDLYSVKYSDGAPEWATLDDNLPHITGDVWSDAYLLSPAVQRSFDNFWNNTPAEDGKGLQDHYAELWQLLAERYKNTPNVIGYDLMNEPFPGSIAQNAVPAMLGAYAQLLYQNTGKALSEEQLLEIWGSEENRTKALHDLNTKKNFAQVIDALYPITADFEEKQLQPFYQKISDAIRKVDQNKILFLEHTYFGNMGVKSSIQRTRLPNGEPDPLVAYAPHGYDLVVDTDRAEEASSARVEFIMERIKLTGQRLGMPVWLGEWGAYYGAGETIIPVARHAVGEIEKHRFSNAYWSYDPGTENLAHFKKALHRPYPVCVNGELIAYSYDHKNSSFKMSWEEKENINAPTLIYFPDLSLIPEEEIQELNYKLFPSQNSKAGWLMVASSNKANRIDLIISMKQPS
ncbi:hypothetical protein GCM10028791_27330 [Echinicola sediminis]